MKAEKHFKNEAKLKNKKSKNSFKKVVLLGLIVYSFSLDAQIWSPPDNMQGNGSSSNPYEFTTAAQLAYLADYVNNGNGDSTSNKYYKLMNDIDLSKYSEAEGWIPIGKRVLIPISDSVSTLDSKYSFKGNFNGNGKVVKNLKINRPTEDYIGFFGGTDAP